jgi:hypothetical protein
MKHRYIALTALLAAPALLALALPREKVHFAPSEGLSLKKTFNSSGDMTLDEMDMLMNGEPMPFEISMDMTITQSSTYAVTDVYGVVTDGRPARVQRSFETLESNAESSMSSPMTGDQDSSMTASSELQGLAVVFAWNAEESDYRVTFAEEGEGDPELLEGLEEDMDLRVLLPQTDVEVGGKWSIEPGDLVHILAPGGNLHIKPSDDALGDLANNPGANMNIGDMLGEIDGTVSGELVEIRERDGERLAVIRVLIEIESSNDMTDMVREMMDEMETPPGVESMSVESVDVELSLDGEGTLLWNLSHGHFSEFTFSGELSTTMDQSMSVDAGGQSMSMEQSMSFSATTTLDYTAERQ